MESINSLLNDFSHFVKLNEGKDSKSVAKNKIKGLFRRQDLLKGVIVNSRIDFNVQFQDFKDIYNTKVFIDNFQRPNLRDSKLTTYVTLEDVKDVVLYTAIYDIPKDFVKLFLSEQVDRILRSLILYMQLFLELFRVVCKRREAVNSTKLRHPVSRCVETLWKDTLSNLRFILGKEYCMLIMGMEGTAEFHHRDPTKKLSRRTYDMTMHQLLHIFARRVVEIVLLEKGNPLLCEEMDRIFQVGGVKVDRKKRYGLTEADVDILEGNFVVSTFMSKSVVFKEFARPKRNPILCGIGRKPWLSRSEPSYFLAIEMVLAGGESRFADANIRLGLLGFERQYFDCFLNCRSPSNVQLLLKTEEKSKSESVKEQLRLLADKSVLLSGPVGLVPKRNDGVSYDFKLEYLGKCENTDEQHMKIRQPRWLAFRKANSRVNYEPEIERQEKTDKWNREPNEAPSRRQNDVAERNLSETLQKGKNNKFPTFFFNSTSKTNGVDDIYASFHQGFQEEREKRKMGIL